MRLMIYAHNCLACTVKNEVRLVLEYCTSNSHTLEIRNTLTSKDNQRQSQEIGAKKPFVYCLDTGKTTSLKGVTIDQLNRITI